MGKTRDLFKKIRDTKGTSKGTFPSTYIYVVVFQLLSVEGLTECGPLEKGMANHCNILALRTP